MIVDIWKRNAARQAKQASTSDSNNKPFAFERGKAEAFMNDVAKRHVDELARKISRNEVDMVERISPNSVVLRLGYNSVSLFELANMCAGLGAQIVEWKSHSVNVLICNNAIVGRI